LKDSYGVKVQIKGLIGTWIAIIIIFVLFQFIEPNFLLSHELYQAFSSFCYLLPSFWELAYPLYKSFQLDLAKLDGGSTSSNSSFSLEEEKVHVPKHFAELFQFAGSSKERQDQILLFFAEYLEAEGDLGQRQKDQYLNLARLLTEMARFEEDQKKNTEKSKGQQEFQFHAKACIWYQRFLKEDSYLKTTGLITAAQSKNLQDHFTNWTLEAESEKMQLQTREIFVQVEANAYEQLEKVKHGFFSSPCFYTYFLNFILSHTLVTHQTFATHVYEQTKEAT